MGVLVDIKLLEFAKGKSISFWRGPQVWNNWPFFFLSFFLFIFIFIFFYGFLLCQISAKYIFEAQTLKIFSLIFKILNQSYIYIYNYI